MREVGLIARNYEVVFKIAFTHKDNKKIASNRKSQKVSLNGHT